MNQADRKGENEVWFRELNELLEDRALLEGQAADRKGSGGPFEIVCECAREECAERIQISFAQYESIRAQPTTFAVAPGHSDLAVERIVASTEQYDVVDKVGEARLVAEIENPRDGIQPGHEADAD